MSTASRFAHAAASFGADRVEGPLGGHHHEAYAVRPDPASPAAREFQRLKLREPRPGVCWFDQRCFASEERLLEALAALDVPRIPRVLEVTGGVSVFGFIEGRTLSAAYPAGTAVPEHCVRQLMDLFRALAGVDIAELKDLDRVCGAPRTGGGTDSTGFLRRLVEFTENSVRRPREEAYGVLLKRLGVPDDLLTVLPERIGPLSPRPYRLLHGDLHRENLIVDPHDELWTIDWELARVGDPLYDLATHLHLMAYPEDQRELVAERWAAVMERALPGGALAGWREDLPRYLVYKRVQSVFTDVVRGATSLLPAAGQPLQPDLVTAVAASIARVFKAAEEAPGMPPAPGARLVAEALAEWAAGRF